MQELGDGSSGFVSFFVDPVHAQLRNELAFLLLYTELVTSFYLLSLNSSSEFFKAQMYLFFLFHQLECQVLWPLIASICGHSLSKNIERKIMVIPLT